MKRREYKKKWYWNNPEKARELTREYKNNNPEKTKQWLENNPKYMEQWRKDNLERKRNWTRNKNKTDLKFNLSQKMSTEIGRSLKGNKKGRKWESLVNYNLSDLIKHLKKTIPKGCTWKDYINGKLVVDHIIPIKTFVFRKPEEQEFKWCWSLYNLRLLSAKENILKHDSIKNPILLGLLLRMCKQ